MHDLTNTLKITNFTETVVDNHQMSPSVTGTGLKTSLKKNFSRTKEIEVKAKDSILTQELMNKHLQPRHPAGTPHCAESTC